MEEEESESKPEHDNNKDTNIESHCSKHKEVSNGDRERKEGGVEDTSE